MNFKIKLFITFIIFIGSTTFAGISFNINLGQSKVITNSIKLNHQNFIQIKLPEFESTRLVGAPELPIKQWLVKGTPDTIKVSLTIKETMLISGTPVPVQEQDCRCKTDKVKTFQWNQQLYSQNSDLVSIRYLGKFRDQPISQVSVKLASYNKSNNTVSLITKGQINLNSSEYLLENGVYRNYLILGPSNLMDGITDFKAWKQNQGYNVFTESLTSPINTTAGIQSIIQNYYQNHRADFIIILGDEITTPMFRVPTSGSPQTPSDLNYFTMDGTDDHIPDIFGSRIVGSTADDIQNTLKKSIDFEKSNSSNLLNKYDKFIGIASNEGVSPSDNEYIQSIENKYKEAFNSKIIHLFQDEQNSNPTTLNSEFNSGSSWLVYIGHGSGTSWPSFNKTYTTDHIKKINNAEIFKPIIIDVACQNGRLIKNQLGTEFMREQKFAFNNANGALAYYGGTVNISWNPPAVMAQGIFFEHIDKNFTHLGEALLAGQLYLASQWTEIDQVIENFQWYHLQGDPGLNIKY